MPSPTKPTTFSSLPPELRQQIYLEALPSEHRIIGIGIIAWSIRIFPNLSLTSAGGDFGLNYLIGAELCAAACPSLALERTPSTIFKGFIQPADTQVTINALAQLDSTARWVTKRVFPNLLRLNVQAVPVEKKQEKEKSRLREFCHKVEDKVRRRVPDPKPLTHIHIRCSLERDIFFINSFRSQVRFVVRDLRITFPETPLHNFDSDHIENLITGARVIRSLQRVATQPLVTWQWEFAPWNEARTIFDEMHSLQEKMCLMHEWDKFIGSKRARVELRDSPLWKLHTNLDYTDTIPTKPLAIKQNPKLEPACCRGKASQFCFTCQFKCFMEHLLRGDTSQEAFRICTVALVKRLNAREPAAEGFMKSMMGRGTRPVQSFSVHLMGRRAMWVRKNRGKTFPPYFNTAI